MFLRYSVFETTWRDYDESHKVTNYQRIFGPIFDIFDFVEPQSLFYKFRGEYFLHYIVLVCQILEACIVNIWRDVSEAWNKIDLLHKITNYRPNSCQIFKIFDSITSQESIL